MTEAVSGLCESQNQENTTGAHTSDLSYPTFVVVGAGPVGVRCAQRLLDYSSDAQVVLVGDEEGEPYNRVRLSQYLADNLEQSELNNPVTHAPHPRLAEFHNRKIIDIDRQNKRIIDDQGQQLPYTKLILATGSVAARPEIPGVHLDNIISFRSLEDAQTLIELRQTANTIVVVGAGALGLETAAALKTSNNRVVLLARGGLLGNRLSDTAESYLSAALSALQVEVLAGAQLEECSGKDAVERIVLSSGETIDADGVVLCTGIKPETTLAEKCGLDTKRGVSVSPYLLTSDPDIYAVGECAEYNEQLYQLVRPGFEQAEICSRHVCATTDQARALPPYQGSSNDIQLKISHIPCFLIGSTNSSNDPNLRVLTFENRFRGLCRELYVRKGKLIGAVVVGAWEESHSLKQAIADDADVSELQLESFCEQGNLWQETREQTLKQQPDSYLVCQCNGVSKGELCTAIAGGKRNLQDLEIETNAGSACGSCRPLMAELLDIPAPNLVMRHARGILVISILSLVLIAIAAFSPPPPVSDSVQVSWYLKKLWYDNFWKQVSGYTLLALCVMTASLSLRKRWQKIKAGHLDHWRYIHSLIGFAALLVLVVHTGFRLGENLNLALMLVFLAATCTGSLVGVFMARNHHWTDIKLREHRKWWSRVHYALLWALPVLLFYHILAVYYF
ncbi:FAD-dependent oxidoreductase [Microbulbifer agarilyticus]|uniref:FAD-dependent oxidoreductase n=1 Tax=Microbulbifer agarilyticus TaxID=260552 RepID=UPI001CD6CA4B|nr:FAD-dependent oxidoreductase [Microbulbifer agarilyticus]MCA0892464.1 FAD-dependent oxidoreductase [Microbulbifer agarilyticus]